MILNTYVGDDKDDFEEEWENDSDIYDDDVDLTEEVEQSMPPAKKGGGVGTFFIIFLLLLFGIGGAYYYISIPQGATIRAMIPPEIMKKIPLLPIGNNNQQIATNNSINGRDGASASAQQSNNSFANNTGAGVSNDNFSAPPMPVTTNNVDDNSSSNITVDDNGLADISPIGMASQGDSMQDIPPSDDNTPSIDFSQEQNIVPENSMTTDSADNSKDGLNSADTTGTMAKDYEASASDAVKMASSSLDINNQQQSSNNSSNAIVKSETIVDIEDRLTNLENNVVTAETLDGARRSILSHVDKSDDAIRYSLAQISKQLIELKKEISLIKNSTVTDGKSYSAEKPVVKSAKMSVSKGQEAGNKKKSYSKVVKWSLQSALPGEAWIVDKNKGNRLRVRVGDVVSGLGKVISIEQDKKTGLWVVRGSRGSIEQ